MNNKRTLNYFLTLYFYQIETLLNNFPSGLEEIKFQSEEANTDEFIKKYFQNFLLKNNRISTDLAIRELVYRQDGIEQVIEIEKLYSYQILDVLLPEQLSIEQKNKIMESKK